MEREVERIRDMNQRLAKEKDAILSTHHKTVKDMGTQLVRSEQSNKTLAQQLQGIRSTYLSTFASS